MTARLIATVLACVVGSSAVAQQTTNPPAASPPSTNQPTHLPAVIVTGRQDSMIGVAASATQGTVGAAEIADRPLLRSGEVLEAMPGLIITQHAGGGKANQYFLRGFNLDHGTDIAIDLDGMPLNLPTHAHGQGYADMNIVIPELVDRENYEKGPYYAADGDFSSAAAAHLEFYKTLPQNFLSVEGGMYGFERLALGVSTPAGPGALLFGGEVFHDDGPWVHPDNYLKLNGELTYSQGDAANGFSITARGYHGTWRSTDQLAESAVAEVGAFGSLNPTEGGASQRYSVQAEWHRVDAQSATKITLYGFYYDLDLFSDFTYYLVDPIHGDQFEQQDHRLVEGLQASHTLFGELAGHEMENAFGLQLRNDSIDNGIFRTEDRVRIAKIDDFDDPGTTLPEPPVIRQDSIIETSGGIYMRNKVQWSDTFRSVAGIRGDIYNFHVNDYNVTNTALVDPANSGDQVAALPSPKLSLIFGPWARTEYYLNGGYDFHSSDARSATATTQANPTNGPAITFPRVNGLTETHGAEIGARTVFIPNLQSTLSVWWLHSDSELLFDNDTGMTTPSPQGSERYGVEWANYYTPNKTLTLDLDYADSSARFVSPDTEDGFNGRYVPEAVGQVLAGGATVHEREFFGSLRLRFFGPRNLVSDGSIRSSATTLLYMQLGYHLTKHWTVTADLYNVLDRRDHDIDYYYESKISPSAPAASQDHFHPVEPIQARIGLTATF